MTSHSLDRPSKPHYLASRNWRAVSILIVLVSTITLGLPEDTVLIRTCRWLIPIESHQRWAEELSAMALLVEILFPNSSATL
jgi:hypothetical protein